MVDELEFATRIRCITRRRGAVAVERPGQPVPAATQTGGCLR